jgi:4-hydroxyphenylpyruvate dioxygenase-like putative hemolysin
MNAHDILTIRKQTAYQQEISQFAINFGRAIPNPHIILQELGQTQEKVSFRIKNRSRRVSIKVFQQSDIRNILSFTSFSPVAIAHDHLVTAVACHIPCASRFCLRSCLPQVSFSLL